MRWIIGLVSALVTLLLVGTLALVLVPADTVAGLAAQRLTAATGRAVVIEGPVRVAVWPSPGVRTGPISIAGPDWSELPDRPMLAARALRITLDPAALATGRLRLSGLEAEGADLLLERHRDGRLNWALRGPAAAGEGPASAGTSPETDADRAGAFDRLRVADGRVEWRDHASGARHRVEGLVLDLVDPAGPATLTAAGRLDGQPLTLSARIEAPMALAAGASRALTLQLDGPEMSASFEGRASATPAAADGRLALRAGDTALGRAALDGMVALRADRVGLGEATLTLGPNRLTVAGNLDLTGPRPRLTGRASAQTLDLTGQGGASPSGRSAAGAAPAAWSTDRIDARALHLLDADITLSARAVVLDALRLGPVRAALALDAGRAVLRLDEAEAFGGQITGQLVANARSGFSARSDLRFAGLEAEALLTVLAGWDRISGPLDGEVSLLGIGDSMAALMASLSGDGRLRLGPGTVRGLDLGALLDTRDPRHVGPDRRTGFDTVTASFTVRDGVLRNDDLRLGAPTLAGEGAGRVDIGAQTLDFGLTAALREGTSALQRLRLPVTLRGPWADPVVSVDVAALIRDQVEERARDEAARLEREARERLQRELDRRLPLPPGVLPGTGADTGGQTAPQPAPSPGATPAPPSPEEALRRRLEQEVGRGLGRLLRGD